MKSGRYTDVVCKGSCKYYKPGRERLECGAYAFLSRNLTPGEMLQAAGRPVEGHSLDSLIRIFACNGCDFKADGCDFRAGASDTPCGGYIVLEKLIRVRR